MTDYTSTFTEQDGVDDVEASDFSTEFNAIQTAIATKLDVDSDTATNLTIGAGFSGGAVILGTEQATTSGTDIDFTGIPTWVKKIHVMLEDVSIDSTAEILIRLGHSGGFENTGYTSNATILPNGGTIGSNSDTTAFTLTSSSGLAASDNYRVIVTFFLKDDTNNTWGIQGIGYNNTGAETLIYSGFKSLSDTLTQLRLTTSTGTGNFDSGSVNIQYEG